MFVDLSRVVRTARSALLLLTGLLPLMAVDTVTCTAPVPVVGEASSTPGVVTIIRSGNGAALTVQLAISGTATADADYAPLPTSAVIPAGASSVSLYVQAINDTVAETAETITVTITANAAYTVGATPAATVTIADDEPTVVALAVTTATATEGAGDGLFTVSRTGSLAEGLSVPVAISGTAVNGTDFATIAGTVALPAGVASAAVAVTVTDDSASEATETVVATLGEGTGYTLGASSGTVSIKDNDPCVATIAATDAAASEPGSNTGTFTVTRTGALGSALVVTYTVGGTATSGSDYTVLSGSATIAAAAASTTITVTPVNNSTPEVPETVIATLAAGSGYSVGTPSSATVTITDDEPSLTITASDPVAFEPGSDTGTFTISRSGSTSAALVVAYTVGGTATAGGDYTVLSGSATIAASSASATVAVTALDDALAEGPETVVATITASSSYAITSGSATVAIGDNDPLPPTVSISGTATVGETSSSGTTLTVTRSGSTAASLDVALEITGTATAGADYTALPASITIPVGSASATMAVLPIDDGDIEPTETVIVTIPPAATVVLGTASATVSLTDDDTPVVTISTDDEFASEPGLFSGSATITLTRTGSLATSINVTLVAGGTATPGSDYSALPATRTMPAGVASLTFTVTRLDDGLTEPNETVVVTVGAGNGYTVGSPNSVTLTIKDDEPPQVVVSVVDGACGEAGSDTGAFLITRIGRTNVDLTIPLSVAGSAVAGVDYAAIPASVTLLSTAVASASQATVTITPLSDSLVEGDETVQLILGSGSNYTVLTPGQDTITLVDAAPRYSVAVPQPAAGFPGMPGMFLISRTGSLLSAATIPITIGGTAVNGTDYRTISTSATFAAGNALAAVPVIPGTATSGWYGPRTVTLGLVANAAWTLGATTSGTVTIAPPDVVTCTATVATVGEGSVTPGIVTITRSGNGSALAVGLAIGGTATADADYAQLPTGVVIPAGSSSLTLYVQALADAIAETGETVTVTPLADPLYVVGTPATATVTIADDETPVVTLAVTATTATEGGADGQFTVTRTGSLASTLTVPVTLGGTAVNGTDYATIAGTVTLASGVASATVAVTASDDGAAEAAETVVLTLGSGSGFTLGNASGTVTIQDNDPCMVTIAATDAAASEPGSNTGTFTVTRTGALGSALVVTYTVGGTATSGSDYTVLSGSATIAAAAATVTITVTPINNSTPELPETVIVTLASGSGYTIGSPDNATVTITDDEPAVSIAASDAVAFEPGSDTGTFTISRSGSTSAALVVAYTVSGTATAGSDYSVLSGSATIAAGSTSTTITVAALDDAVTGEGAETVIATLSAGSTYAIAGSGSATVSIGDNDPLPPTVTISGTATVAESSAGATLTLTRSGSTAASLVVALTVSGTAASGDATVPATVTIPSGSATAAFTVAPVNDSEAEAAETVVVGVATTAVALPGTPASATVTIADDDTPVVTIDPDDGSMSEPGRSLGNGSFTLTRVGNLTSALTVSLAVGGTATPGADYTALPATVTIPAGAASVSTTVYRLDDSEAEPNETVVVTVASGSGYSVGSPASVTLTIYDDETPVVVVDVGSAACGEGAGSGTFIIRRTGNRSTTLSIPLSVAGSATSGVDYTALPTSVSMGNNVISVTVTVAPIADSLLEGDETVQLILGTGANYTIATPVQDVITIVDAAPRYAVTVPQPDALCSGVPGLFLITRSGTSTAAVTIPVTIGGTAVNGVDYRPLTTSVTFAAGLTQVAVPVIGYPDPAWSTARTVTLGLVADSAYSLGAASGTVTLAVGQRTPDLVWVTAPIKYGTALSATELGASSSVAGTYVYSPGAGTVLTPGDYLLGVTFTPNDLVNWRPISRTAMITVEYALVKVAFAQASSQVTDDAGDVTVPVRLSSPAIEPLSISYRFVGGTTVAGVNFIGVDGTLSFGVGETVKSVPLSVTRNAMSAPDRTVELELTAPSAVELGTPIRHVLTIRNSFAPVISSVKMHPQPVKGTSGTIHVDVYDDRPLAQLSWNWASDGPAPVSVIRGGDAVFSATFTAVGTYHLTAQATDADGLSANGALDVVVVPSASGLAVAPATSTIIAGSSLHLTAQVTDQFGGPWTQAPITWTADAGSCDADGTWHAPLSVDASTVVTVQAHCQSLVASSHLTVQPRTSETRATPDPLSGTYFSPLPITVAVAPIGAQAWYKTAAYNAAAALTPTANGTPVSGPIVLTASSQLAVQATQGVSGAYEPVTTTNYRMVDPASLQLTAPVQQSISPAVVTLSGVVDGLRVVAIDGRGRSLTAQSSPSGSAQFLLPIDSDSNAVTVTITDARGVAVTRTKSVLRQVIDPSVTDVAPLAATPEQGVWFGLPLSSGAAGTAVSTLNAGDGSAPITLTPGVPVAVHYAKPGAYQATWTSGTTTVVRTVWIVQVRFPLEEIVVLTGHPRDVAVTVIPSIARSLLSYIGDGEGISAAVAATGVRISGGAPVRGNVLVTIPSLDGIVIASQPVNLCSMASSLQDLGVLQGVETIHRWLWQDPATPVNLAQVTSGSSIDSAYAYREIVSRQFPKEKSFAVWRAFPAVSNVVVGVDNPQSGGAYGLNRKTWSFAALAANGLLPDGEGREQSVMFSPLGDLNRATQTVPRTAYGDDPLPAYQPTRITMQTYENGVLVSLTDPVFVTPEVKTLELTVSPDSWAVAESQWGPKNVLIEMNGTFASDAIALGLSQCTLTYAGNPHSDGFSSNRDDLYLSKGLSLVKSAAALWSTGVGDTLSGVSWFAYISDVNGIHLANGVNDLWGYDLGLPSIGAVSTVRAQWSTANATQPVLANFKIGNGGGVLVTSTTRQKFLATADRENYIFGWAGDDDSMREYIIGLMGDCTFGISPCGGNGPTVEVLLPSGYGVYPASVPAEGGLVPEQPPTVSLAEANSGSLFLSADRGHVVVEQIANSIHIADVSQWGPAFRTNCGNRPLSTSVIRRTQGMTIPRTNVGDDLRIKTWIRPDNSIGVKITEPGLWIFRANQAPYVANPATYFPQDGIQIQSWGNTPILTSSLPEIAVKVTGLAQSISAQDVYSTAGFAGLPSSVRHIALTANYAGEGTKPVTVRVDQPYGLELVGRQVGSSAPVNLVQGLNEFPELGASWTADSAMGHVGSYVLDLLARPSSLRGVFQVKASVTGSPDITREFLNPFLCGQSGPASAWREVIPNALSVDMSNGNVRFARPVAAYGTTEPGPDVWLTYNSLDGTKTGVGYGWRTNYDSRVIDPWWIDEQGTWFLFNVSMPAPSGGLSMVGSAALPQARLITRSGESLLASEDGFAADEAKCMLPGDGRALYFDRDGYLVRIVHGRGGSIVVARGPDHEAISATDNLHRSQDLTGLKVDIMQGEQTIDFQESGVWNLTFSGTSFRRLSLVRAGGAGDGIGLTYREKLSVSDGHIDLNRLTSFSHADTGVLWQTSYNYLPGSNVIALEMAGKSASKVAWYFDTGAVFDRVAKILDYSLDATGVKTEFAYGSPSYRPLSMKVNSIQIQKWGYDSFGRLASQVQYPGGGSPECEEIFDYEFAWHPGMPLFPAMTTSLLKRHAVKNVTGIVGGTTDLVTRYEYATAGERSGLLAKRIDPDGAETLWRYTSAGRLDGWTDARRKEWKVTEWSLWGDPQAIQLPGAGARTQRQVVDQFGYGISSQSFLSGATTSVPDLGRHHVGKATSPDGSVSKVELTANDLPAVVTSTVPKAEGGGSITTTVTTTYDTMSRPTLEQVSGRTDIITTYTLQTDSAKPGWRVTRKQGQEILADTWIDFAGRLRESYQWVSKVAGSESVTQQTTVYAYDAADGRLKFIQSPGETLIEVTSDFTGRALATKQGAASATCNVNALGWVLDSTDRNGQTSEACCDAAGRLRYAKNSAGGWQWLTYDATGALKTTASSTGVTTANEYDDAGILAATIDPWKRRTEQVITGGLVTITDPQVPGVSAKMAFDGALRATGHTLTGSGGLLAKTTITPGVIGDGTVEPAGRGKLVSTVDDIGRQKRSTVSTTLGGQVVDFGAEISYWTGTDRPRFLIHDGGLTEEYVADPITGEINELNSNAHSFGRVPVMTVVERDPRGRALRWRDGDGRESARTFDALGRLATSTPAGMVKTTYSYVGGSDRVDEAINDVDGTRHFTYHALGGVIGVTRNGIEELAAGFDQDGRREWTRSKGVTRTTVYDPVTGAADKTIGPDGETVLHRNGRGLVERIDRPGNRTVEIRYDLNERPEKWLYADNTYEQVFYDVNGDVSKVRDRAGHFTTVDVRDGTGDVRQTSLDTGEIRTVAVALRTGGGFVTTTTETIAGVASVATVAIDAGGATLQTTYPGQTPVTASVTPGGRPASRGPVSYEYPDANTVVVKEGNQVKATLGFQQDQLVSASLPNGHTREVTYEQGRLRQSVERVAGLSWTTTYDWRTDDRLGSRTTPFDVESYTYSADRLAGWQRTGYAAATATYGFDAAGHRTSEELVRGSQAPQTATFTTAVAPLEPALGTWAPTGSAAIGNASGSDSLATMPTGNGPLVFASATVGLPQPTTGWRGAGLVVDGTTGVGGVLISWDEWRAVVTVQAGSSKLEGVFVHVDATGEREIARTAPVTAPTNAQVVLSLTRQPGGMVAAIEPLGAGTSTTVSPLVVLWPTLRGRIGVIGTADGSSTTVTVSRLSWTRAGTYRTRTSVYNTVDQLTQISEQTEAGSRTGTLSYVGGNQTGITWTDGSSQVNGFDHWNRLTSQSMNGQSAVPITYIPGGVDRLSRGNVTYRRDGQGLFAVVQGGQETRYGAFGDLKLYEDKGGTVTSLVVDHDRTVRGRAGQRDGSTMFLSRLSTDPTGEIATQLFPQADQQGGMAVGGGPTEATIPSGYVWQDGATTDGLGWRGLWFDAASKNYQMGHRAYAADTGSFLQRDPAQAGDDWYAYCGGDPVNRADPSGLDWVFIMTPDGGGDVIWRDQGDGEKPSSWDWRFPGANRDATFAEFQETPAFQRAYASMIASGQPQIVPLANTRVPGSVVAGYYNYESATPSPGTELGVRGNILKHNNEIDEYYASREAYKSRAIPGYGEARAAEDRRAEIESIVWAAEFYTQLVTMQTMGMFSGGTSSSGRVAQTARAELNLGGLVSGTAQGMRLRPSIARGEVEVLKGAASTAELSAKPVELVGPNLSKVPGELDINAVLRARGDVKWKQGEAYVQQMTGSAGQQHFPIPWSGGRYVDAPVNLPGGRISAAEVKTYQSWTTVNGAATRNSVPLSDAIKMQIWKDVYLRRHVNGYDPRWVFLEAPPSSELADFLQGARIPSVIHYPPTQSGSP